MGVGVISDPKKFVAVFAVILRGKTMVAPIQKVCCKKVSLQILVPPEKKRNIVFRNEGGGAGAGQRPFGSFPKIHPFL